MSVLPKGWVHTEEGAKHYCGVECVRSDVGGYLTRPGTCRVHPTLDAAIAALEPHVEAWREAVREAVGQTAKPVAAERDPLVDPRPGDGIEATLPSGAKRWIDVAVVDDGRVWYVEAYVGETRTLGTQPIEMWRKWPAGWTIAVVRRGAP
jgi:hypothetical protein